MKPKQDLPRPHRRFRGLPARRTAAALPGYLEGREEATSYDAWSDLDLVAGFTAERPGEPERRESDGRMIGKPSTMLLSAWPHVPAVPGYAVFPADL